MCAGVAVVLGGGNVSGGGDRGEMSCNNFKTNNPFTSCWSSSSMEELDESQLEQAEIEVVGAVAVVAMDLSSYLQLVVVLVLLLSSSLLLLLSLEVVEEEMSDLHFTNTDSWREHTPHIRCTALAHMCL